jgi:hypothetical protein
VTDNIILEAVLGYAGRGLRILPLHHLVDGQCSCGVIGCKSAGKHPAGHLVPGGLKDATIDQAVITKWWQSCPAANPAVATGPDSGVFVVGPDGDSGLADLAALEAVHGPLPRTPTARTGGGGAHLYFRWPADGTIGNRRNHRSTHIDVRGAGGYVVAPPGTNKGGPYTWEVPFGEVEPADAPVWLLTWARGEGESTFTGSVPDVRRRAILYLSRCPPAISGQGGHDQTFAVARAVVYGFNLGPDVSYQLLAEHYNPRCVPPWSEKELRHKVEEADTKPLDKPRGYLLGVSANGRANGQAQDRKMGPLEDLEGGELVTHCLKDDKAAPVDYLVDDYIPLRKVTMFFGRGGMGKSVVTLDVAACVTTGKCAFGLTYTPPLAADVLLCSAEDDVKDTIAPRLLAAGADMSRVHTIDGLRGRDGLLLPFSLAYCPLLARKLEAMPDVRLVVIDPIGVFVGRTGLDSHKEAPMQALLADLRELAEARGVAIILVGHTNKSQNTQAHNRLSGAAAFINSVRGSFMFVEDEDGAQRLMLQVKVNLCKEPTGLRYDMRPLNPEEEQRVRPALEHLDEARQAKLLRQLFRIEWKGMTSARADDVLAEAARKASGATKDAERAADWLKAFLAGGPQPSEVCVAQGNRALGLARRSDWWSGRVLRDLLGGKPRKLGQRHGAQWWYWLPGQAWPPDGAVHVGTPDSNIVIDQEPPGSGVILRGPWPSAQEPQGPQEPQESQGPCGAEKHGPSGTAGPDPQEPHPASSKGLEVLEVVEGVEVLENAQFAPAKTAPPPSTPQPEDREEIEL